VAWAAAGQRLCRVNVAECAATPRRIRTTIRFLTKSLFAPWRLASRAKALLRCRTKTKRGLANSVHRDALGPAEQAGQVSLGRTSPAGRPHRKYGRPELVDNWSRCGEGGDHHQCNRHHLAIGQPKPGRPDGRTPNPGARCRDTVLRPFKWQTAVSTVSLRCDGKTVHLRPCPAAVVHHVIHFAIIGAHFPRHFRAWRNVPQMFFGEHFLDVRRVIPEQ